MLLSASQMAEFTARGFVVPAAAAAFSPAEVAALRRAYDDCLAKLERESAVGAPMANISRPARPGQKVHQIRAAHLEHPLFDSLIRDRRCAGTTAAIVAARAQSSIVAAPPPPNPPTGGGAPRASYHAQPALIAVRGKMGCQYHGRGGNTCRP